jgi:hypothetical protein
LHGVDCGAATTTSRIALSSSAAAAAAPIPSSPSFSASNEKEPVGWCYSKYHALLVVPVDHTYGIHSHCKTTPQNNDDDNNTIIICHSFILGTRSATEFGVHFRFVGSFRTNST